MTKLTSEEKKKTLGGMPRWQCFWRPHGNGMRINGSNELNTHYKISNWIKHNPNYIGNW